MAEEVKVNNGNLELINQRLRRWIVEMTTVAGSGHPTSSLSAVELMSTLMFGRISNDAQAFFHFDAQNPDNQTNDRLIFSKGHAAPLYYALWAMAGEITVSELMTLRKFDSVLEGHPTRRFGLTEVPTGSLGQGLSVGVGMALHGRDIAQTDARIFVLLGDSEMAEGQVAEAMQVAAYYKLANLVAIVDVNRLGQRGETMLGWDTNAYKIRAEAYGWHVIVVDGHDIAQIIEAYAQIGNAPDKPTMIIAQTVKGKGVSFLENSDEWHGRVVPTEQLEVALAEIGVVGEGVSAQIMRPNSINNNYLESKQTDKNSEEVQSSIMQYTVGDMVAPRDAYGDSLAQLVALNPAVVVLDAETSNSTRADRARAVAPERFFEIFIAEQNMVSVAVGMSRRGARPFVSTFAAFFTRAADQIRMAQYARVPLVCVGSHCGVSIGADGSSQMGLEDMALFGALREGIILYPADATSMAASTALAVEQSGIIYIRSTRAKLPVLYTSTEKFKIGGSKILRSSDDDSITIIAAGITVHEALAATDELRRDGMGVRVIDCYSVCPIDSSAIIAAAHDTGHIIVVEDHYARGGLGDAVKDVLVTQKLCVDFTHLCVRKEPRSGTPAELIAYCEIDKCAIISAVQA